jgi:hypothetical protein
MNKLSIAIISVYLIIILLSACATNKPYEDTFRPDSRLSSINQSIGLYMPVKISSFPLNIIPPSSGVQFYRDGIVFLSQTKNEVKMLPEHLSFGTVQAYYAVLQDTILGQHSNFIPSVAFPYPCEALSFTNDYNTMYFTRLSEADKREKVFHAEFSSVSNRWSVDPKPLDFCQDGSSFSHPAVATDGSFMIFASNIPGYSGGMDLFMTRKVGQQWTKPENLGIIINTHGNEICPFLDTDNNLFFSSDGHSGSGGFDIFISRFNGKGWDIPLNLTKQINSADDDIAFTINNTAGNTAFLTKRQKSRSGKIQLYKLDLDKDRMISDLKNLSDVLYSLALSEIDSIEVRKIMARLEAERIKAESLEEDSLKAARLMAERIEAERLKALKTKADNIEAAMLLAKQLEEDRIRAAKQDSASIQSAMKIESERLEAERLKAAKIKADSILAAKKEADRIEAEKMRLARLRADSIEAARLQALKNENPDIVIYKVQVLSTVKSKGKFDVSVNGRVYSALEYFYQGEYRYTIGEFNTPESAAELQNACRKAGYPQAFVAAFKNKVRSTDPVLFK